MIRDGAVQDRAVQDGAVRDGAVRDGVARELVVRPGAGAGLPGPVLVTAWHRHLPLRIEAVHARPDSRAYATHVK
ncbi:hypothetical protein GCM10022284_19700 [Streptomyces hundungensis]